jgi:hypothetical protein
MLLVKYVNNININKETKQMSIIVNKSGKIVHMKNVPNGSLKETTSLPQTNWVEHTKKFAYTNNMSFGDSLSNVNNRCQYYDTMIDRNKYNRGPNLLQPDHPAMHPFIPNLTEADKKIKNEILVQTKRSMCGKTPTYKK